jgi:formate hydrogenlyase subunit 6/NADH:ubiquinone oxidoreductase subunit I
MTKQKYKGIKREKIPWYPTLDYKKCTNCGQCIEYCKLGVYSSREKQGEK